jgi:hypothetical protein
VAADRADHRRCLLNKDLIALLALGLLGGVLLTGPRQVLRSGWLPVGAAIALVTVAPNLWWQAANDWPQLTVAGGISDDDGGENRAMFVPLQLMQLSPVFVPFAVVGGVRVWRSPWARSLLTAYAVIAVVVLVVGGKPYYALPPVLALVAAGCQPVVEWARSGGVDQPSRPPSSRCATARAGPGRSCGRTSVASTDAEIHLPST